MKLLGIFALVVASGCFEDSYRCTTDAQCDLGEGGRCELDNRCTKFDITCPTQRRYAAHAAERSEQCFDDRVVPANACAGGQPPARPEGCFATVCERIAACCEIAWTDACVQVAHEVCAPLVCDTRIAVTASRGMVTELWDLTWTGQQWLILRRDDRGPPLAWVGPAPGALEPRLASTTATEIVIGETTLPIPIGRTYQAITSVGFDRDGRDTIAASYQTPANDHVVEIWKLDDGAVRETPTPGSQAMTWGDENRDAFPDAIAKNGGQYSFLDNLEGDGYVRKLSNQSVAGVAGGATPGTPGIRAIEWLDFDRDGNLDLVVFGSSVRIHTAPDGLTDVAQHELDCDPPSTARPCAQDPEPNLESASFAGAALTASDVPELVVSAFPGRKVYRARLVAGAIEVVRLPFPGSNCSCAETCTMCPGANCSCTYDCMTCLPVLAIVVRDLDGDHRLDIVAIDARLQVYTGLAANEYTFGTPTAIPTTFATTFFTVNVSTSGLPIP